MYKAFAIVMIILWLIIMINKVYCCFSHSHVKNPRNLREDAKIKDVRHYTVGSKNSKKICTTVSFDDGFQYESFKTDREDSVFSYKIKVSEATAKEILQDAVLAHEKAFRKAFSAQNPGRVGKPADAASLEAIQGSIPRTILDYCKELAGNRERIDAYLKECVKQGLIRQSDVPVLLDTFASPAQPDQEPAMQKRPSDRTEQPREEDAGKKLRKEFLETYLQTLHKPLGAEEDAWNWMINRIVYFKQRGLGKEELLALEHNMITKLPNCYQTYFSDFLRIVGDMTPIVVTCERLLEEGNGPEAKAAAEPYLNYLLAHPEKYTGGQYCFQSAEEAALCTLEGIQLDGPPAEDNYTMFFVLYCRILDSILHTSAEDANAKEQEKEKYLKLCLKMSPCNATVWEALAQIYSPKDEQAYQTCIQKALRYSLHPGEPYGLGTVYGNLAFHYARKNPELARALCVVSRQYEGNPMAAEFLLSKFPGTAPENPDRLLDAAGIQRGYSQLVNQAKRMAAQRVPKI